MRLHVRGEMPMRAGWSRRMLLSAVGGLCPASLAAGAKDVETVYSFSTSDYQGRMSVVFFDRYSSRSFRFREQPTGRPFCLSPEGNENTNCLTAFSGSLAVARYQLRRREGERKPLKLREHVRTIDQEASIPARPDYDRALQVEGDVVSDIQAFGYQPDGLKDVRDVADPWCLLRQDLYLEAEAKPFLIVHWKHSLSAIRLLDVIPGNGTAMLTTPQKRD